MKMLVMVLTDLAASCKKLDETSELPEELPVQVCEFVAKFFDRSQATWGRNLWTFAKPCSGSSATFQLGTALLAQRFCKQVVSS